MKISVKDVRRKLREVLDRVAHGEDVIVTRRGVEVAQISPVEKKPRRLPMLDEFRSSIGPAGTSSAKLLREDRDAR